MPYLILIFSFLVGVVIFGLKIYLFWQKAAPFIKPIVARLLRWAHARQRKKLEPPKPQPPD